ncbi:MAG TPA: FAD-binding oxidoreductase [Casimicrobiaceae bacterium]|nr:FAD-binding oxidoreductase [Casimicrobiaceae bacterium]
MADTGATWIAQVAAIVGPANLITAPADIGPYVVDWRGRFRGAARGVARPGSTQEVARVVEICARWRIPVVAQGGNTGLCGAATPDDSGDAIVLSLTRMNRIRDVDVGNTTMTVEAGVTLAAAQVAATERGLLFPLSLASEGSCTVGGNLSTNAGGTAVLRYGNARDLTLGLEVVLADGAVLSALRGLRKDNTGYDLKQLFIGAEGTLGIITAAVFKLFAAPKARVTGWIAVDDVDRAVHLLSRLKSLLADRLVAFELVSGLALALSRKHHPGSADPLPGHAWYVLVQIDDPGDQAALREAVSNALASAIEDGLARDATIAQSDAQSAALWALRENISEAQRREGPNIKHDISLPISAIPRFLVDAQSRLSAALPGVRFVVFGHLGDGNLHYNLSGPEGVAPERFMDNAPTVHRIVYDLVDAAGGSISAEHGIGQLKREELARYKLPVEVAVMRRVKAALDPHGLMNPGKVL